MTGQVDTVIEGRRPALGGLNCAPCPRPQIDGWRERSNWATELAGLAEVAACFFQEVAGAPGMGRRDPDDHEAAAQTGAGLRLVEAQLDNAPGVR